MKKIRSLLPVAFSLLMVSVPGTACSRKSEKHEHAHGHHHTAPHGGTLVEIGEHQFNLELVRDADAGTLTLYVLDAHAENFLRISTPVLPATAMVGGMPQPLAFQAAANAATGETVGATSQFVAQAEWLKKTETFDLTFPALEIRGAQFADVKARFPTGGDEHGH